jgi:ubiquinone/menaquinone biosynthesis C-methylase UbiE
MATPTSPFTDPAIVRGQLYATPDRLNDRTNALRRAKISGPNAAVTLATLAAETLPTARRIIDIGCGQGTSTLHLARQYPAAAVCAVDLSPALLGVVRQRVPECEQIAGDFHHLPIASASIDLAVAAFCLYHSPHPRRALADIARCLHRDGRLIVATKSADSYRTIDILMSRSGLDPEASRRASLYQTFHSANAGVVAIAAALRVLRRVDEVHTFRFADLEHLAHYAATNPNYHLGPEMTADPARLAAALRARLPDTTVTTTSTVTYLVLERP